MASPAEAPADAAGPTSHTHFQPHRSARLSPHQLGLLFAGIHKNRISQDGKGFSHVEAWDIRRYLIRIFGFGGYDTDVLETVLIAERSEQRRRKDSDGQEYGAPYTAWTVIYRIAMKLTVKVDGVELGHWHGVATGDATHQTSLADAHDLALKTADSQALKRAATNLGDQFGLSLYNSGSPNPVVERSLAYIKPEEPAQPVPDDQPVHPEPSTVGEPPDSVPADSLADTIAALKEKIRAGWSNVDSTRQNLGEAKAKGIAQEMTPSGPDGPLVTFEELLNSRINALCSTRNGSTTTNDTGRSAA